MTISSVTDIKTWVEDHYPDLGQEDVQRATEAIQDDDHPPYGTNWNDFLEDVDVIKILQGAGDA